MGVHRVGDWLLAQRILTGASARVKRAIDQAVLQEAHFLRAKIVAGIVSQAPGGKAFKPLAASTLAIRKFKRFSGTKALLNRGDLRNSISVKKESHGAFVGVLRTARGRQGQPLANVAELNEWGSKPIVITITPKMRRFLAAALSQGGGGGGGSDTGGIGVVVVQIPARPFIRPVVDRYYGNQREVAGRFLQRVGRALGGDFGGPGVSPSGRGGSGLGGALGGGTRGRGGGGAISWLSRVFRGGGGGPERDPATGRFRRR